VAVGIVGIVGAGTMGAGIAQLALEAGHRVMLHDVDAAAIARGRARIRSGLERRAARLDLDPDSADAWVDGRLERLRDVARLEDVAGAGEGLDLVVEAALEDLEAKRAIFAALDGLIPRTTMLATNTSALSVTAIAAATTRPERVLGLHFFNPAPIMPLVEVILTAATDPAVAERATGLMAAWGKTAVCCADTPGFIVNRVNRPFTLEALAILAEGGATIEAIDDAIRTAGFPMGPFELMDLVGIDINLAAAGGVFDRSRDAGDPLADRFRPSPVQVELVAESRLGRKTGAGFYEYGPDGRPTGPAHGFAIEAGIARLPDEEIVARITLAIVNEAYRALGDGVASADDIDLAMRLGAAHPSGPFDLAASLGGPAAIRGSLLQLAGHGPRFEPAPALLALG
jgi:3-hydroxybutyryl-CoA dehydrogenase